MKKVRISLAALTLILAIAGTTTANATKTGGAPPCGSVDPDGNYCTNGSPVECCTDEDGHTWNERGIEE
jgi:hypothetical protein